MAKHKKSSQKKEFPTRLPGDPSKEQLLEQFIRVDHAGEYGAVRIYEGQLAVLKKKSCAPVISHMLEQEKVHKETFDNLIIKHRVRPTALMPLWHLAGFALGATTAMMGKKAAMACTVGVEDAIDEHYQTQIEELEHYKDENELRDICIKFREEELEHRDTGIEQGAEQALGYEVITNAVKAGSRLAIWFSKRI